MNPEHFGFNKMSIWDKIYVQLPCRFNKVMFHNVGHCWPVNCDFILDTVHLEGKVQLCIQCFDTLTKQLNHWRMFHTPKEYILAKELDKFSNKIFYDESLQ